MIKCPECGFKKNSLMNERCLRCGTSLGFPNVNDCSRKEEVDALKKRYREKVELATKKGKQDKLAEFEKEVKKSVAVKNVDLDYLHYLIVGKHSLDSNYQLQTEGETRDFARSECDKERRGVEGTLFGSYGKEIRYAALSLDGSGLESYGDFTLVLADDAVKLRATLLEDNSYFFVRRHNIIAGGKIPAGYQAVWADRHKLATAKLAEKAILTKKENYAKILLKSKGHRKKDEFIEVLIYGAFAKQALDSVRGTSEDVPDEDKKALIRRIKDHLKDSNIKWIEE